MVEGAVGTHMVAAPAKPAKFPSQPGAAGCNRCPPCRGQWCVSGGEGMVTRRRTARRGTLSTSFLQLWSQCLLGL